MVEAWRIDSIDARAGLTFVSWRDATLFDEGPLEEAPTFYIGAPSFTPQPVANRGVALAAERQGFQLGLLDRDGEVAFSDLDDVAEFVRRLYLASARGDLGPPLPLAAEGSPDLRGPSGEALELPRAGPLGAVVAELVESELARGDTRHPVWREEFLALDDGTRATLDALLRRGSVILLVELLRRFPITLEPEALERWRRSARTFAALARRLELWRGLTTDTALIPSCEDFLNKCWSRVAGQALAYADDNPIAATLAAVERQSLARHWPYDWYGMGPASAVVEPMDELAQLPIPRDIAAAIGASPERANLGGLLSVALASPDALATGADVEALLLIAAARVVAVEGSTFAIAPALIDERPEWDSLTIDYRSRQMVDAALGWLAENLPAVVFDAALEAMIRQVGRELEFTDPTGSEPQGGAGTLDRGIRAEAEAKYGASNEATAWASWEEEQALKRKQAGAHQAAPQTIHLRMR